MITYTTFPEAYDAGILSQDLFLKSKTTKEFVDWLVPFIDGPSSLITLGYGVDSFTAAILGYSWGADKSFQPTYDRFENWREQMRVADDGTLLATCVEILKWGGVSAHNEKKLQIRKSLREFLTQVEGLVNSDEIVIDDLNPNYINSGFTKIYTASNRAFFMYDGRVGSALCCLIKAFLLEQKTDELPAELKFTYGIGRGNDNRNPNDEGKIKFAEITQNRSQHFVSNIKANWLLKELAGKVSILKAEEEHKKAFALQTALFVLGKKIPV